MGVDKIYEVTKDGTYTFSAAPTQKKNEQIKKNNKKIKIRNLFELQLNWWLVSMWNATPGWDIGFHQKRR